MPKDFENTQKQPIEVFFSYSHKDEKLRDELSKHLSMLKRQGVISVWHDRQIPPGTKWKEALDTRINQAQIILLLISSDFLASDYCYETEGKCAMERHERGEAIVLPIILRPCRWKGGLFEKLQALPIDLKPVTKWPDQDDAFTNIVEGICDAVHRLQIRQDRFRTTHERGEKTYLLCDRDAQEAKFDRFIHDHRDARVLVCGIQAAASDLPDSLVKRLTDITLYKFFGNKRGQKEGVIVRKVIAWPDAKDASTGLDLLLSRIYRGLESDERKPTAEAFVTAISTNLEKVIVLRHEIHAERWKAEDQALMNEYLSFWYKVQSRSPDQQFVVFFNLVYPEEPSGILRWSMPWTRFDRQAFSAEIQQVFNASQIPNLMLKDLSPIERLHVKDWLDLLGMFDESECLKKCDELFKKQRSLSMKEVEPALKKLLN